MEPTRVLVAQQGRRCDARDVVDVDEGLEHRTGRHCEGAGQDGVEEVTLIEVQREPARAHDRRLEAEALDDLFAGLRSLFPAARKQDELSHARLDGQLRELLDRGQGLGHRQVRLVADVGLVDSRQRLRPGARIVPLEGRASRAGAAPHGPAGGGQAIGHRAAGLAVRADHEGLRCSLPLSSLRGKGARPGPTRRR
jgi:hypothetical protein